MGRYHLGVLALVCTCLLVVPSWSDNNHSSDGATNDNQMINEERNAGEPNGETRILNQNKNRKEEKKEKKYERRRNRNEKKKERRYKKNKKNRNKKEKKLEKKYKRKYNNSTKIGHCTGTASAWSCCSSISPCQEKQGDCDKDSHCAGSLVCGKNNCRDFNPLAQKLADCCMAPCTGTSSDWSCCSSTSPCQEKHGDCDQDSHCAGSLVCGKDNCKDFNPQAQATSDCCIKAPCTGMSSHWSCCSNTSPCQEKQGDCDEDSHCADSLVCGKDNCRYFNPLAPAAADCCIKPDSCTGTSSDWSCCSSTSPCQEEQGDCDGDSHCAGSLVCGKDNCKDFNPLAHKLADCCIEPIESSCKCGVKKGNTRIVGGVETSVNEYPWMVALSIGCGGSVIADRWLLTAAHCFYRGGVLAYTNPREITITLGEHDRSTTTETSLTKTVTPDRIIIHDSYNFNSNLNDIALLRLPSAIDLNTYTPVCLPPQGEDYTGKKAWVYGWGTLWEGGPVSNTLKELEITILSDAVAKNKFKLTNQQLAVMIFAGEKGKDTCQGDSGGPLSYDNNGQHELVGATSWGIGCAREGKPGAYAEVSAFRHWIDNKIVGANTC